MDVEPEIKDASDAAPIENVVGDIELRNVGFTYSDSKNEVLSKINLHVHPGDNVALVGPSGGGKTTLSNLIPRFYDVTEGEVLLDGRDIRKITLSSLRSSIGVVQQDVYLFSGTIYDNILYGKPDATYDEVIEAAKLAGADEFISELDEGYETYVGERGNFPAGKNKGFPSPGFFLKTRRCLFLTKRPLPLTMKASALFSKALSAFPKGARCSQ